MLAIMQISKTFPLSNSPLIGWLRTVAVARHTSLCCHWPSCTVVGQIFSCWIFMIYELRGKSEYVEALFKWFFMYMYDNITYGTWYLQILFNVNSSITYILWLGHTLNYILLKGCDGFLLEQWSNQLMKILNLKTRLSYVLVKIMTSVECRVRNCIVAVKLQH